MSYLFTYYPLCNTCDATGGSRISGKGVRMYERMGEVALLILSHFFQLSNEIKIIWSH